MAQFASLKLLQLSGNIHQFKYVQSGTCRHQLDSSLHPQTPTSKMLWVGCFEVADVLSQ
jgi:hypothetical protein